MSPRSSDGNPQPDIYVGLLFVSVGALATALVFLLLELSNYGFQMPQ
jgi:hypothetical protein